MEGGEGVEVKKGTEELIEMMAVLGDYVELVFEGVREGIGKQKRVKA